MTPARFDADTIRNEANGRWPAILSSLSLDVPISPKQHGPCPTCGGKDRFRFDDQDGKGTWFCNQCQPQAGDGFALVRNVKRCDFPEALRLVAGVLGLHPTNGETSRTITATYDYTDAAGALLFQVVRYEPKDFRQRRPDGHGGWIPSLHEGEGKAKRLVVSLVLYHLPRVIAASHILVVEGEKDVETASRLGLPDGWAATCNPMGAEKWLDSYSETLAGKNVVILPDSDKRGEKHGALVSQALQGKALSVQRLTLPDGCKDLSEWAGDRTQADLHGLLSQAQPWSEGEQPTIETDRAGRVTYRRVADIEAKPINWLWPDRIARGKVSMIAGNPGLGKSQITASMAATVSTGGAWPVDRTSCEPGNVVILSAEDDPADTIRPRLEAAGADLDRCFVIDAVIESTRADGNECPRSFNLQTDLARLGTMLESIGGAALIVIDPITAYLGGVDSHKNAEVRALLSPLSDLAGQYTAAVVCVSHLNKSAGGEALLRVMGSVGFVAAARAAFVVAKDPDNDTRRLFLPLKNNIGNDTSGLAFTVQPAQINSAAGEIDTSCVVWEAESVLVSADSALSQSLDQEERGDLDEAKDFLRGILADGPVSSKQVRADVEGAGHAWRTIRRAQKALGIEAVKEGMEGGWVWRLDRQSPAEGGQETPKASILETWPPSHSSGEFGRLRETETGQMEVEI